MPRSAPSGSANAASTAASSLRLIDVRRRAAPSAARSPIGQACAHRVGQRRLDRHRRELDAGLAGAMDDAALVAVEPGAARDAAEASCVTTLRSRSTVQVTLSASASGMNQKPLFRRGLVRDRGPRRTPPSTAPSPSPAGPSSVCVPIGGDRAGMPVTVATRHTHVNAYFIIVRSSVSTLIIARPCVTRYRCPAVCTRMWPAFRLTRHTRPPACR